MSRQMTVEEGILTCIAEISARDARIAALEAQLAEANVDRERLERTLAVRNHESDFLKRRGNKACARIAALKAQLAERVKVKALEWNECKFGGVLSFDAKVGFGDLEYSLQSYDDGTWGWFTSFRTERGYSGCMGKGLTLEVAKAAAQADFERRILSALEATPPAPKVTEAQAEVVAKLITKWLGRSWEGLPEGRVTEKGFPVFSHSQRGWGFNGRKGDMIDLAREALTAAQEAGKQ